MPKNKPIVRGIIIVGETISIKGVERYIAIANIRVADVREATTSRLVLNRKAVIPKVVTMKQAIVRVIKFFGGASGNNDEMSMAPIVQLLE
jgi:hypothetical protein